MKEQSNGIPTEQVYGMFEEIKEIIEKRPASEASGGTAENSETVIRKLDENKSAIDHTTEQVTALTNRIGQIDFRPIVQAEMPDMKDLKKILLYIALQQKRLNDRQRQIEDKQDQLKEQIAQMKTEVDTTEYKKLSDHTIFEMKQQIRYLKQPPIVLKVIIGLSIVSLVATLVAGYYIRDSRKWKDSTQYWYEQSLQNPQPKAIKKGK